MPASDDFLDRYVSPTHMDLVIGGLLILLVLESTRRATGWIMPILSMVFFAYALWGNYLPSPWKHKGYPLSDMIAEELHDAERHLRLGHRRLGHADHPVHHLRRHPAGLGRRPASSSTSRCAP